MKNLLAVGAGPGCTFQAAGQAASTSLCLGTFLGVFGNVLVVHCSGNQCADSIQSLIRVVHHEAFCIGSFELSGELPPWPTSHRSSTLLVPFCTLPLAPSLSRRMGPFAGVRIGEASHPGPPANSEAMIQLLLMLASHFLGDEVVARIKACLRDERGPSRTASPAAKANKRRIRRNPAKGPPPPRSTPSAKVEGSPDDPDGLSAPAPVRSVVLVEEPSKEPAAPPQPVVPTAPPRPWLMRKQDWPEARFISVTRLVQLVDSDSLSGGYVLLLSQQSDWTLLHTLRSSHRGLRLTLVFESDVTWHTPSIDAIGATEVCHGIRVPFAQGNSLQLRTCTVVRCTGDSPSFQWRPAVKAASSSASTSASVVLRCKADRRFCHEEVWRKLTDKPGTAARIWASGVAGIRQADVHDTWGWKLRAGDQGGRPVVHGLLRVSPATAKLLLSHSGALHQGRRFFLEPVDWASATWLPERDHGIDWQRRLSKDEPWLEYASRIQSMSLPLGLACGSSQLGVRKIGFTSPSLRFWRIKGVPLAWDSSELATHLVAAGFSRVDVDNRSSGGRYASWTFRAVCDDAVDSLEALIDDRICRISVIKRSDSRKSLPIKCRDSFAVDGAASSRDPPPSEGDGPSVRAAKRKSADCEPAAAAPGSSPPAPSTSAMPTASVPDGMSRESNAGQGDCLFLAAGQSCHNRLGRNTSALQLRLGTVAHMRLLRDKFEPLWDGNSPESGETPMPNRDFSAYLDRLASRRTWGGALELTALAEYLDVAVLVLGPHHPPALYNIDAASRMLALWFQDDHYECLNGPLPEDLLHVAAEGSSWGMRGGVAPVLSSLVSLGPRRLVCHV